MHLQIPPADASLPILAGCLHPARKGKVLGSAAGQEKLCQSGSGRPWSCCAPFRDATGRDTSCTTLPTAPACSPLPASRCLLYPTCSPVPVARCLQPHEPCLQPCVCNSMPEAPCTLPAAHSPFCSPLYSACTLLHHRCRLLPTNPCLQQPALCLQPLPTDPSCSPLNPVSSPLPTAPCL